MKTIETSNRTNLFRLLAVAGVIGGAIYFFRRRGGTMQGLIAQGKDLAGRAREKAAGVYENIAETTSEIRQELSDASSSAKESAQPSKSRSQSETSSVH